MYLFHGHPIPGICNRSSFLKNQRSVKVCLLKKILFALNHKSKMKFTILRYFISNLVALFLKKTILFQRDFVSYNMY